jgi:GMP synthase-like glutamine amidotransferase
MSDILVVKDMPSMGAGLLEDVLIDANISFDLVDQASGADAPSPKNYDAMVVFGAVSRLSQTGIEEVEIGYKAREAVELGIPYLGYGLGHNALASGMGSWMVNSSVRENGVANNRNHPYTIALNEKGRKDPIFCGLPDELNVFQQHDREIGELPKVVDVLAYGKTSAYQAIKVGKFAYGIQPHFELTGTMLAEWADKEPRLEELGRDNLVDGLDQIQPTYTDQGHRIARNFLKIARLI